jgi:sigma-B regulation protein RsbU (phosphoserine phosphatase)
VILTLRGEHHGQQLEHALEDGATVTVGRGSANDVVLASQTVSRNHARLAVENGSVRITDLGSLNGTRINGTGVEGEALAHPGDAVEFGSVLLELSDGSETTPSAPIYSDETDVSRSVVLSRDDITDSHSKLRGSEPVLRLLTEAGQLLVLPESPERTFDRILELVEKTIPADRILILVSDEPGAEPVQRAARVHGDRAIGRLMLSRTMVRMVMDEGAAFLTGDAQSDERFMNQQSILAQDLRSAMAVPLVHHEDVLGVVYVDTSDPLTTYTEHDLRVLTLLGQMLGAKIANAKLLEIARQQERMAEELRTARAIQQRILPQQLPEIAGWEFAALQDTCDDVGGDLYDAGPTPDGRLQFCLADVSGHGIPAALLMFDALATIRALRGTGAAPGGIAAVLDTHLLHTTEPEHYLTAVLAELDPESGRLTCVNAGHPEIHVVMNGGEIRSHCSTSMPIGLIDLPKDFEEGEIEIPRGATVVVYSDGVSEAARGEEQFGDRQFARVLGECGGLSATEVAERIRTEVDSWLGDERQDDDVTLFVLRRLE